MKKAKFDPIEEKEYILTDMCYWKQIGEKEMQKYNPYDKTRAPHGVMLIDPETGTTVNLLSGSIIKVVKSKVFAPSPTRENK